MNEFSHGYHGQRYCSWACTHDHDHDDGDGDDGVAQDGDHIPANRQPHPQGLLLDDFQNGGSSGESPSKGWVTWYKISKNLGDFYHVTF